MIYLSFGIIYSALFLIVYAYYMILCGEKIRNKDIEFLYKSQLGIKIFPSLIVFGLREHLVIA